jgi:hypothetical protein
MFVGGTGSPYLAEEYEEARRLRSQGVAIKRIASELGVSPGTVHRWTTDIVLTAEQRDRIEVEQAVRWRETVRRRNESWSHRCRERRRAYQREGRERAREGDPLHQAGCMLYWAEGTKDRNTLAFCNSDRAMVVYFKRFLLEQFELPAERFTVALNVYLNNGLTLEQIEADWLRDLELPPSCALKHITNHRPTSSSGKRRSKLPYGVCVLKVRRGTRIIQHIYGAIQEYTGLEEPAWLD